LAAEVGVSHSTVHRIWQAHDLKPHRIETFKFSTDPAAEEKIHDVVGLYMDPPTHAVVLSVDEKTQIQALNRTQPLLPLRPGVPARQTHDYRRNGLTSLYAALEVASGTVVGECQRPAYRRRLSAVPERADAAVSEARVCMSSSTTRRRTRRLTVRAWLEAHPRVHFHFTPTGASWLNMVEAWFSILTRKSVRRGSFNTVRALITHIKRYIARWNDHPTPFVWTKEPAAIIKKALRRAP
jgi:hypothetical protein